MPFPSISRKSMISCAFFLILTHLFIFNTTPVFSQDDLPSPPSADDALEEELRYLKAETYVITASRVLEDIKKTASSVTVITDRQIRQMGAKHLSDVLQTVPGMNYFYYFVGNHSLYASGLPSQFSHRMLLMVNSHPLNENHTAGAITYDNMILDNVKRIEFMRGPGSALYGANAFAGVINVITKEAEDVDGWEVTARGGSYDTQQYNLLYGKTHNDLEITFNYNYFNTHGFNGHVDEDYQTARDRLFLTNASLAPGRMRGDEEKYDASLTMKYKGFKLDGRYVRRDWDLPVGWYGALSRKGDLSVKDYYLNLSYERTLFEGLDLLAKVYRNHDGIHDFFQHYPEGSAQLTPLLVPVIMPKGMIHSPSVKNNRTGFEIQTTWRTSDSNTVVAGITYEEMKQYDVKRRTNYLTTPIPLIIIPLPYVRYRTDIQNYNRSVKRNFKAFFIEDIWDITDNLRFTLGVRYDDYSDFGSSVNPRAGLTWEFIKGYDLKLLYGSAFRAPSFAELYNLGTGDPNLDPEKVDTYQVSLGAEVTPYLSGRVTWFWNSVKDYIDIMMKPGPQFFRQINLDQKRSEGLIVEMKYDFGRGTYLAVNYTHTIFKEVFIWVTPKHMGNVMANIRLSRYLNFYAACHFEDGWRRDSGDKRDDMSGYGIVNVTLIAKKFLKGYEGLELRGSVYNLFNKDYTSPAKIQLPHDTPRPGRNFMVEVKYKF